MNSVTCPYCNSSVDEQFLDKNCPQCGNLVKSQKWLHLQAEATVRYLKKHGVFERVKTYIWNNDIDGGVEEIRKLLGKTDEPVEKLTVEMILQDKPNTWIQSEIPNVSTMQHRSDIQKHSELSTCPVCNGKLSTRATACPHCGNPTGVHTCPKCGSTNTKTISGASKAASIYLWGPFAANKVVSKFQCKDCWHKF